MGTVGVGDFFFFDWVMGGDGGASTSCTFCAVAGGKHFPWCLHNGQVCIDGILCSALAPSLSTCFVLASVPLQERSVSARSRRCTSRRARSHFPPGELEALQHASRSSQQPPTQPQQVRAPSQSTLHRFQPQHQPSLSSHKPFYGRGGGRGENASHRMQGMALEKKYVKSPQK